LDYISDSFYRFTPKKEYLFDNLKNGFYPRYNIENYDYLLKEYKKAGFPTTLAIPMVCFCDIPIVFINEHIKKYGNFAIAMKKEWGIKNLNPILYLTDDSIPQKKLELVQWDLMNELKKELSKDNDVALLKAKNMFMHYQDFIAYLKKYKGLTENKKEVEYYREREWRWIPEVSDFDTGNDNILRLDPSDYKNIEKENEKLKRQYKLKFHPEDVDYIIVDNNESLKDVRIFLSTIDKAQLSSKIFILKDIINKRKELLNDE